MGTDRYGGIAEHGLRAGGGYYDIASLVFSQGVTDMPQVSLNILMVYLEVG